MPTLEEIKEYLDKNSGGPTDEEFKAYMENMRKKPIIIKDKKGRVVEVIRFDK